MSETPSEITKDSARSENRYSLREMIQEVQVERRDSLFGRELLDTAEIERMFHKRKRKIKKKPNS